MFTLFLIMKPPIFSWRFSREKCPTLTVASFFFVRTQTLGLGLGPQNHNPQTPIFSWRFSREKCPTLTVASFFSSDHRPHRVCTTFLQTSLSLTCTRQYSVYGEPSGHRFESLLQPETFSSNIFRHCATQLFSALCPFFSNFFLSPNGPPFKFLDILQQTEVSKSPKGPLF